MVVVAELLVEVVHDAVRPPPADRYGVDVDDAERGDERGRAEKRPHETPQVVARQLQRAAEEERADGDEVVPGRECDRVVAGAPAERRLRNERICDDDEAEREREAVDDAGPERQPPRLHRVPYHARERDDEQDLLPGRDRRQRRAADAGCIERRHSRVVQGEADDVEVERGDRASPNRRRRNSQEHRVDHELEDRHGGERYSDRRPRWAPGQVAANIATSASAARITANLSASVLRSMVPSSHLTGDNGKHGPLARRRRPIDDRSRPR